MFRLTLLIAISLESDLPQGAVSVTLASDTKLLMNPLGKPVSHLDFVTH